MEITKLFFKPSSTETRMLCPACNEIIRAEQASCRYCGAPIDEATGRRLSARFRQVTDAVARANNFKQSKWAVVFLVYVTSSYVFDTEHQKPEILLWLGVPIGFLAYVISWQGRYGKLDTLDKDYPEAVRAMHRSLRMWTIVLLILFVMLIALILVGPPLAWKTA